jgi:hypothetical protein
MVDASVQNAISLAKLTNEPTNILRLRENMIEQLGLDLIIDNVESRYKKAEQENWHGRTIKHRHNIEEFLEKVCHSPLLKPF